VQENDAVPAGLDQQGPSGIVFDRAATQRQNNFFLANESKDRFPLAPAEFRLAIVTEDFRYRTLARRFDYVVQVDEFPAQFPGQDGAHSGFTGAHETGQD
jgi:hypothetical protein